MGWYMKRREFIKKSVLAGLATGAAVSFLPTVNLKGMTKKWTDNEQYDLVAIRGGSAADMFDEAMKSFGGMKSIIKPNSRVLVKPNIGWDAVPERAANTNPLLVNRVVQRCYEAGAKEVLVFDHTCDAWQNCYTSSGIEKAVSDAKGKIVPGNHERYYGEVTVSKGKRLKSTKVHELVMETDHFIDIPILKNHSGAKVSLGMKNHMGIVWDRGYWHRNDLQQCIADFATFRVPDLTIIDGYNMLKRNGPRGVSVADVVNLKAQIVSRDIVAADAAATRFLNFDPKEIGHIQLAAEMGVGRMDIENLKINRIKL